MNERGTSTQLAAAICLLIGTYATCNNDVSAMDVAYETSLGIGHSDNIRRTSTDELDEDIAAAGLRFSLDQLTPRLEARAVGDLAYHEYLDDTFDSDVVGNLAADARLAFLPDRLEWIIADNFGQVLADPFVPATPDNRENINYFTTGPDVMFGLGTQNRLRLAGRYSLVSYEDSPFDSDAVAAEIGFIRALSAANSVSLNARTEQVEFDEVALDADYDQSDAFVRYDASGARTHLTVDLGYSEVDREASESSEDGVLVRLDASRRLSGASTARLTAGREFSNSGTAFATAQESGGISLGAVSGRQTALPFTHEYVTLGWNFARNRTGLGILVSRSERTYDDVSSTLDQTLTSLGGNFSRQLSTQTQLLLDATYGKGEFVQEGDYDELNGSLSLRWQLSRSLSFTAMYSYYTHESDLLGEVTENRFWLSIAYGSGNPRREYAPAEFAIDERI